MQTVGAAPPVTSDRRVVLLATHPAANPRLAPASDLAAAHKPAFHLSPSVFGRGASSFGFRTFVASNVRLSLTSWNFIESVFLC